jgi:hypothetical protein
MDGSAVDGKAAHRNGLNTVNRMTRVASNRQVHNCEGLCPIRRMGSLKAWIENSELAAWVT